MDKAPFVVFVPEDKASLALHSEFQSIAEVVQEFRPMLVRHARDHLSKLERHDPGQIFILLVQQKKRADWRVVVSDQAEGRELHSDLLRDSGASEFRRQLGGLLDLETDMLRFIALSTDGAVMRGRLPINVDGGDA